ncbi:hypothetical protein Acsp05_56090 [Actinokineospora sp. NBRC 105648]|nr:hypothetical protein Acsp05_56090 [Actinokineospora sp. NBRC 105648]
MDRLGTIPLHLTEAAKSFEAAPSGIPLGLIELGGWRVRQLDPVPTDLAGHAAYLVRAHYNFAIEPEVPAPAWAEIKFEFPIPGVTVLDAIPRAITRPIPATTYDLNAHLDFIPGTGAIPLPALEPRIDCTGIGTDSIQWTHTGGVPTGAHTACFVLLTPPDMVEVPVVASGSYHVSIDPALKMRPTGRKDAFVLPLPTVPKPAIAEPTAPETLQDNGSKAVPTNGSDTRVFVSYAHESPEHKAAVATLCDLLRTEGITVHYDRQNLDVRRNWDSWINTQIMRADYVLTVASPSYLAAGNGTLPPGKNLGVLFEYRRLADLLHRQPDQWTPKVLPVVLPGRSPDEIPLSFLPGIADYYQVDPLTTAGAKSLLRVLRSTRTQ